MRIRPVSLFMVFLVIAGLLLLPACKNLRDNLKTRAVLDLSGAQGRVYIETTGDKTEIPLLRLHGSNTIGSELAPHLAKEYLKWIGAKDIREEAQLSVEDMEIHAMLNGMPVYIEVKAHGSSTAFKSLEKLKSDIGLASRRIKPDEAEQLGFLGDMLSVKNENILCLDGVAVIVNKDNPINSLSVENVAKIFAGKITNWSQVGGTPGEIVVLMRNTNSGTFDTLRSLVLARFGLEQSPDAKYFEDSTQLSETVGHDKNAIGFIGLPYILDTKAISISQRGTDPVKPTPFTIGTEDYLLSRRLYLYAPENPETEHAERFIEFAVSWDGQKIAQAEGFIPSTVVAVMPDISPSAPLGYMNTVAGYQRLSMNFRFNPGSDLLDNKSQWDLRRLKYFMSHEQNAKRRLLLVGLSDNSGNLVENIKSSRTQAQRVADLLKADGLNAYATGFGSILPIESNDTPEGRTKNRRIEVWLK